MPGVPSPLAGRKPGDIDFWVVRENTEGEYSSVGGRMFPDTDREVVTQQTVMTRIGVDRILKFAFDLAQSRPKKHLTSATKSNGISITMPYWDERVEAMAKNYPDVKWDKYHIDILTANFVLHPDWFNVVVGSNLFGDILSDLGPACTGTIGIAPSGNINPERKFPSVFEPVHGSAPDIAGQGIANPIGMIWSGAMMLEHLGETTQAADAIVGAIERTLGERTLRTRDLGGNAEHGRVRQGRRGDGGLIGPPSSRLVGQTGRFVASSKTGEWSVCRGKDRCIRRGLHPRRVGTLLAHKETGRVTPSQSVGNAPMPRGSGSRWPRACGRRSGPTSVTFGIFVSG